MSAETRLKSGARVGLTLLSLGAGVGAPSVARADSCSFELGFATLHDLIPQEVGNCRDNESHNPDNGDALQHTSGGLLVWRKKDNWTAFTNGYMTWINGPKGLERRLNTQRFPWEGDAQGSGLQIINDQTNEAIQQVKGVEVPMTPEQIISDIDIRYTDPNRVQDVNKMLHEARQFFSQTISKQDLPPEAVVKYQQEYPNDNLDEILMKFGTFDAAILKVDSVGSKDLADSACLRMCYRKVINPQKPYKKGSIRTEENFFQNTQNTRNEYFRTDQIMSVGKEIWSITAYDLLGDGRKVEMITFAIMSSTIDHNPVYTTSNEQSFMARYYLDFALHPEKANPAWNK